MKILAIGAHADDVELGCGGSLIKWGRGGHDVTIFVATDSGFSAPDGSEIRSAEAATEEARASAVKIGAQIAFGNFKTFQLATGDTLNTTLLKVVEDLEPDLVLTHWDGDVHNDHRCLALASLDACRHVPRLFMYTANHYRGSASFDPRIAVDISATLADKLDLIKIFASEYERAGEGWEKFITNQAALHGQSWNVEFAEAFMVVKHLMD